MKKVAVIIINFNSSDYTIACIRSITEQTAADFDYEIIVVDNNSALADYEQLRQQTKQFPHLNIHRSILNLGFSGGNMYGLQFAKAEYCYFLNNDCVLLNDNLKLLYDFMQANPTVGICCGQMYNTDLSFHNSFGYLPGILLKLVGASVLRAFSAADYPSPRVQYTEPVRVPLVTGAAMFIDVQKLSEIGGFDTNYFLYCEEEDIATSMKSRGYSCYLLPAVKFIHHMGKSSKPSYVMSREFYISLLYYHRKHHNYFTYQGFKLIYLFKNLKRIYKGSFYLKLSLFILSGAPLHYSLKRSQKITLLP